MRTRAAILLLIANLIACGFASAEDVDVTANVRLQTSGKGAKLPEAGGVVAWLSPTGGAAPAGLLSPQRFPRPRLVQKNKSFQPHVLVVPVGASVEFPNKDPFFHNVFSLFEGKRFDLGLYEAGTTRNVVFDKPGISYIFCNIHAEMSAVVIALATPYYGISNPHGQITIPHVPTGRYTFRIWYEGGLPETLNAMTREITVAGDSASLGLLELPVSGMPLSHKNMYGRDYPPPSPGNPAYVAH
jgi:hypothetical protein